MWHFLYKTLAVIILSLLLLVALGGVSQNNKWKINQIKISGTQVVDTDALWTFANDTLQGNYFFTYARANSFIFPRRDIETGLLENFPRLKSVTAHRSDAHTIAVEIMERKPLMLWCGEEFNTEAPALTECWFVDEDGFIFDQAPTFSEGVYREIYSALFYANEGMPLRARVPPLRFTFVRAVEQWIERELGDTSRVFIKPEGEYGMIIRSSDLYPILYGAEVRFNDGQPAERLIHNLLAALPIQFPADGIPQKKLNYIDLRFGNKVFFGFEE